MPNFFPESPVHQPLWPCRPDPCPLSCLPIPTTLHSQHLPLCYKSTFSSFLSLALSVLCLPSTGISQFLAGPALCSSLSTQPYPSAQIKALSPWSSPSPVLGSGTCALPMVSLRDPSCSMAGNLSLFFSPICSVFSPFPQSSSSALLSLSFLQPPLPQKQTSCVILLYLASGVNGKNS